MRSGSQDLGVRGRRPPDVARTEVLTRYPVRSQIYRQASPAGPVDDSGQQPHRLRPGVVAIAYPIPEPRVRLLFGRHAEPQARS